MPPQSRPGTSNSFTVRLRARSGPISAVKPAGDDAVRAEQHEVELEAVVDVAIVAQGEIDPAGLAGLLQLVELECQGGGLRSRAALACECQCRTREPARYQPQSRRSHPVAWQGVTCIVRDFPATAWGGGSG